MVESAVAVAALREIAYLLERSRQDGRRASAYRAAASLLDTLSEAEFRRHSSERSWRSLPGLGESTATVVAQVVAGRVPDRLAELRSAAARGLVEPVPELRAALRGDLHCHSDASDGSTPIAQLAAAAAALGHEYLAITDHSPRLRVANGLSPQRLTAQLEEIAELNRSAPLRILTGIEVDILTDGGLDQRADLLARLDVVVASVHSGLRMASDELTHRMVAAIVSPHVDILGHCTGRLVGGERGTRPQSTFDAEVVFEACRQFGVAVEINSRPERCDPPDDLLALAAEIGCDFAIDTDAHAPGQLEFCVYGAERAERAGIPAERIITTWPLERLLVRTSGSGDALASQ